MTTADPRVDAYIAKAAPFARPILAETRARIRKACPSAEETIKWNVPFYVLGGRLLASMAAFKAHAKIGVWTGMKPDMVDVTSVAELPPAKVFAEKVKAAAQHIGGAGKATPAAAKKKTAASAKKPAAKKPAVKKSAAKKPAAKKPAAKK
ncbi:MAG: hypothetical protein JWO86_6070 [Myxococcaceae bacterium]|jgi:topoisomerase IA-like protein|nr:hypothetical protein [Myxococcaceae bacterium]MEA2751721.1 hypothetical protein [Myxococcales bacterium]